MEGLVRFWRTDGTHTSAWDEVDAIRAVQVPVLTTGPDKGRDGGLWLEGFDRYMFQLYSVGTLLDGVVVQPQLRGLQVGGYKEDADTWTVVDVDIYTGRASMSVKPGGAMTSSAVKPAA